MSIAKIEEIVGTSDKGWEDAGSSGSKRSYKDNTWHTWFRSSRSDSKSRYYYWRNYPI